MLKNVLKLSFFSLLLILAACAHKKIELPSYEGRSLDEALSSMQGISGIDTKFSVEFQKNEIEMKGDAALDLSNSGDMSLRLYSLGFLAMELTSKDGIIKSSQPLDKSKKTMLTKGLRDCLFWWDIKDYAVYENDDAYVLDSFDREVWIDKKTFLPVKQNLYFSDGREVHIYYEDPAKEKDMWYQSKMRIELSKHSATLTIKDISFSRQQPGPAD